MLHAIPPGPRGNPILGNLAAFNRNTLGFLEELSRYGDTSSFRFGPYRVYFFNHPDMVRDVLVTQARSFQKTMLLKAVLGDIIGENIFTSDGDYWRQQRKLMQPAFHSKRIGAYADVMVSYTRDVIDLWDDGQAIDIQAAMTSLTMNIVSKTLFDADVSDETQTAGHAMTTIFSTVDERFERLLPTPTWLPTTENRKLHAARDTVRSILKPIIAERRRSREDHGDLLSMLVLAQDEDGQGMSDAQVLQEAMTIFGAGHETTANALTWTLYLLSQNPQVAGRLAAEVDEVLANRPATLSDLEALPYSEMVIKESMRLYPPAWGITRQAVEDVEIGGYLVPKDTTLFVSPWTLGRDARWFPHPQRFEPERFSPENEARIPKYTYIPFGGGPRVCIGNSFAMMEARLILVTIAQRYRFSLAPGQQVAPERVFTLRPRYGMSLLVHIRQDKPVFT